MSGGAITHGTPYGDIVFNGDATEAHFTRTSSNALAGNTSQTWSYEYVGQKNKAGATAKGLGGALAGAMNVRHAGRVDEGGIEVYLQTRLSGCCERSPEGATQAAREQNIQSFQPDEAVVTEFDKWKHKQ